MNKVKIRVRVGATVDDEVRLYLTQRAESGQRANSPVENQSNVASLDNNIGDWIDEQVPDNVPA